MSDFCIVLLLISFFLGMGNGIYLIEGNETLVINVIFVILGFVGTIAILSIYAFLFVFLVLILFCGNVLQCICSLLDIGVDLSKKYMKFLFKKVC